MTWTKAISIFSALFVFLLTIIALVLTYNALQAVAFDNGLSDWRSYLWPLTIDGALIVFSLSVIAAALTKEPQWLRWAMTSFFILLTIMFNALDVGADKLPEFVTNALPFMVLIVPPVALAMAFETLMSMVRRAVRHSSLKRSICDLSKNKEGIVNEVDTLKAQRARIKAEIDRLTVKAADIKQTPRQKRLSELPALVNEGMTPGAIADRYGVSERTVYRDAVSIGIELSENGT